MTPLPPVLIDIYNHVMPLRYLEALKVHGKDPGMVKRMTNLTMLWDIEARVQMLEKWPHVQQVLSLSVPSPEMLGEPRAEQRTPAGQYGAGRARGDVASDFVVGSR